MPVQWRPSNDKALINFDQYFNYCFDSLFLWWRHGLVEHCKSKKSKYMYWNLFAEMKLFSNIVITLLTLRLSCCCLFILFFWGGTAWQNITCWNWGDCTVFRSSASVLGNDSPSGRNLSNLSCTSALAKIGIIDSGFSAWDKSIPEMELHGRNGFKIKRSK